MEHSIEELILIDDLKIYKTNDENYIKYKKTIEYLYEVEKEQVYTVPKIVNNEEEIIYVQLPGELEFKIKENVPWHLDRISKRHLPLNNSYLYNNSGSCHKNNEVEIETVVVDTGVVSHDEFGENQPVFLENFSGDNINKDCNSHGTFCSSQIGGIKAGVCKDAKLFAVKVLSCDGSGSTVGVLSGMEYVFKRHIKRENPKLRTIMSMSLGGGYSRSMNLAIEKMIKTSDTFYVVVASGNENQDGCKTSPASAEGILTVNAMNKYDKRAYFSNYGTCTHIYSPGVDNYGAILNGKYAIESGTSFSTPIMAGVMNHILDENPELNMKGLRDKILSDATKDTIIGNKKNTPNLMVYIKRKV
jgi:subtilisin family serine protease